MPVAIRLKSDVVLRDQLIADYAPLVRFIARRIAARLPSSVDIDDLISVGVIGLMDAIDKFDPSRDNKFKTYAEIRIRGAILDELRAQDLVPRSVRDQSKEIDSTTSLLEQRLGRRPDDREIADTMGVTLDELFVRKARATIGTSLLFGEAGELARFDKGASMRDADPHEELARRGERVRLLRLIEALPERQRLVLALYYYEGLNLKEIGRVLDITESRVSQIHSQALRALRRRLLEAPD